MLNKTKEYRVDKKVIRQYSIIFLVIAIPLIIFSMSSIIESYEKLATFENGIEQITTMDMNGSSIIQSIMYQNALKQRNRSILFFIISLGILFIILHFYFFTNIKLLFDDRGIRLYSIYRREPSKELLWKDIKFIQFGNIYTAESRILQYQMKIIYSQKINDELNNTNITIPIKKFHNYKDIIKDIEQIGNEENIDVFHMND